MSKIEVLGAWDEHRTRQFLNPETFTLQGIQEPTGRGRLLVRYGGGLTGVVVVENNDWQGMRHALQQEGVIIHPGTKR